MVDQIDKFEWYHKIDLGGVVTPGYMPHFAPAYKIPDDLTGKRVLDVGAWDGYWTFEALKRGAKEVVAIDDWSDMPNVFKEPRVEWDTFDFAKETLGYTDDQCKRISMSLYNISLAEHGAFDVVFFFGALYHCRYPLLALDKLSGVCLNEIYIESAVCNDFSPYRGGLGKGYDKENDVVMEFYPTDQFAKMPTNWWSPTTTCLSQMLFAAGWKDVDIWKFNDPCEVGVCRGFAKGKK